MAKAAMKYYRLLAIAFFMGSVVRTQVVSNEISGFSLSPKYFNLATESRISATATCGEDNLGRPRSDLFCKLVGGPTTDLFSQTIQVRFSKGFSAIDLEREGGKRVIHPTFSTM